MIYGIYFLAILWIAGCSLLPLYVAFYLWNNQDGPLAVVVLLVVWPLGVFLAAVPCLVLADSQGSSLSLKKDDWACSSSHNIPVTTYVKSGNVMVPITTYHKVCDRYDKIE